MTTEERIKKVIAEILSQKTGREIKVKEAT